MPISLTGLSESVTLNCPDSSSQISVSTGNDPATDEPIFKLEILPDLVSSSAYFVTTPTDNAQLVNATVYFTLCYTLVIKCELDRKSTRLNSSHANISYAVFCLKKK